MGGPVGEAERGPDPVSADADGSNLSLARSEGYFLFGEAFDVLFLDGASNSLSFRGPSSISIHFAWIDALCLLACARVLAFVSYGCCTDGNYFLDCISMHL